MNVAETLRSFIRRWYITVPGIALAIAVAVGAWLAVPPAYQRAASVLLLPGTSSLPEADANPYLYLGGLTSAAEVLVRAVGSENTLRAIDAEYPGTQVEILRDGSTGGPVVRIVATASTDAIAAAVTDELLVRTGEVLDELQSEQSIPAGDRITLSTITVDDESTIQQRSRLATAGALGVVALLLVLVTAAVVDGLSRRRRGGDPEGEPSGEADATPPVGPDPEAQADDALWLPVGGPIAAEPSGGGRRRTANPAVAGAENDARMREPDGAEARIGASREVRESSPALDEPSLDALPPQPRRSSRPIPRAAASQSADGEPDVAPIDPDADDAYPIDDPADEAGADREFMLAASGRAPRRPRSTAPRRPARSNRG